LAGYVDRDTLVRLSADTSAAGRKQLLDAITILFISDNDHLKDEERQVVYDILRLTIHDLEMGIRRSVAEHLAKRTDAPSELVNTLANDEIDIAFPILVHSPVLEDAELVEIVRQQAFRHRLAVTFRKEIGEQVSDALVATGNEKVICSLLKNGGAKIAPATLGKLADQSKIIVAYQKPILYRADLPPELAKRMFVWVSVALRQYILDKCDIPKDEIEAILGQAVVQEALAKQDGTRQVDETTTDKLVSLLANNKYIDFTLLFEAHTGIPQSIVLRALTSDTADALAVACKAGGIGKAAFAGILAGIRRTKSQGENGLQKEVRSYMLFYDKIDMDSAKFITAAWKQNADFEMALSRLKLN